MSSDATSSMPEIAGTRLTAAGINWDAVKATRYYGLQALALLPEPGSVAVDPVVGQPLLYFFVPAGSTEGWDVPQSTALSAATHIVLPPGTREGPPGPYWLIAPEGGVIQHTDTEELRKALIAGMTPSKERAS